jgi:hypothetical protein
MPILPPAPPRADNLRDAVIEEVRRQAEEILERLRETLPSAGPR